MKTLKYLIGAASVMMAASFAGNPASAQQVTNTPHDLTSLTANGGTEQVCVYCHTPHNGAQGSAVAAQVNYNTLPLWNRQADGGTIAPGSFQTYTSPTLDAGTAGTAGAPAGVSLGCLSCHDGATALDSLIVTGAATAFTAANAGNPMGAVAANLGSDLRNDHPVSITYGLGPVAADWVAIGSVTLPLYGASNDQVECGSCHNPHDNSNGQFLRQSNASSNLCLQCHVK